MFNIYFFNAEHNLPYLKDKLEAFESITHTHCCLW